MTEIAGAQRHAKIVLRKAELANTANTGKSARAMTTNRREGDMRDYQREKNNKYKLPSALYNQIIWQIRDFYRLVDEYESIVVESKSPSDIDGMPHGSISNDGMDRKIIKMAAIRSVIDIIRDEKESIPEEYRQAVWNNILYRTSYPLTADRTTYARWKSRMIYNVALRQGLIKE